MMATTSCSSPILASDIEQDSPLQSAFSGIDVEKLAQDDRFLDRIAYVCQKMKVPHLHVGQVDVLRNLD
jgi:hypothetical protein